MPIAIFGEIISEGNRPISFTASSARYDNGAWKGLLGSCFDRHTRKGRLAGGVMGLSRVREGLTELLFTVSANYSVVDVGCVDSKILFEYSQALRGRYLEQLAKLPWEEVVKSRGGSFDSLPSISVRVEDVLVHAALENIHHFGELIALLWQIDVEPPHMGWIGYLQR
jgi:hypothetical protein